MFIEGVLWQEGLDELRKD